MWWAWHMISGLVQPGKANRGFETGAERVLVAFGG
jgi:hypothetical protein